MAFARSVWVTLLYSTAACSPAPLAQPSGRTTPPVVEIALPATALDPAEGVSEGPKRDEPTGLDDLGISVTLPREASREHQAEARRHVVALTPQLTVEFLFVPAAAPTSVAQLNAAWRMPDSEDLGQGETPGGVLYIAHGLRVRVGFEGMAGQHIHRFEQVTRVYAVLPLDRDGHVRCTGYIEFAVESATHPEFARVRDMCLSMRKR